MSTSDSLKLNILPYTEKDFVGFDLINIHDMGRLSRIICMSPNYP